MKLTRLRIRSPIRAAQSLVEFAILLPAVLILILLIVRAMMILNIWFTLTQSASIAVRTAALTGQVREACQIVSENLVGFAPERLKVIVTFGEGKTAQVALCQFTTVQVSASQTVMGITITPTLPRFIPPITPSVTPQTPTPGQTLIPTRTPDRLRLLDTRTLPDLPIKVEISYDVQLVGPLVEPWKLTLGANAIARLEARIRTVIPTPTREFF